VALPTADPEPALPVIEAVVVPTPAFELVPRSGLVLDAIVPWLCRLRRQLSKSWLNCCSRSLQ
jgi:hypothetical protein